MGKTNLYLHPSDATRLLDEFAAAALPAVVRLHSSSVSYDECAGDAYQLALAMLKARQEMLASGRLAEVPGYPAPSP